MNHAVRTASQHHVGVATTDDLTRFTNGLATGRTSRQAIQIRALRVEHRRQVSRWHVGFLFQLFGRIQQFDSGSNELRRIVFAVGKCDRHHFAERREILVAFSAAKIDTKSYWIGNRVQHAAVSDRLLCRACGELGVPSAIAPKICRFAAIGNIPVLNFGAYLGGESTGVEERCWCNAALSFLEPRPDGGSIMPHGVDHSDSGNDYTATHRDCFRDKGKTATGRYRYRLGSEVLVDRNSVSVSVYGHMKEIH